MTDCRAKGFSTSWHVIEVFHAGYMRHAQVGYNCNEVYLGFTGHQCMDEFISNVLLQVFLQHLDDKNVTGY